MPHTFIFSPVPGHVGYFQLGTIVSRITVNLQEEFFVPTQFISLEHII